MTEGYERKERQLNRVKNITSFARIRIYGSAPIAVDCSIKMLLDNNEELVYQLSKMTYDTILFIPITHPTGTVTRRIVNGNKLDYYDVYKVNKVTVSYKTIMNESILYTSDIINQSEYYQLQNEEGDLETIMTSQQQNIQWKYPGNRIV